MSILKKFQKLHTAVTFAEAGEHGTALAFMGREPKPQFQEEIDPRLAQRRDVRRGRRT